MNYLENDFLLPVIIGSDKNCTETAKKIYQSTKIKPHIFSDRFSWYQRLFFKCHKIFSFSHLVLCAELSSFPSRFEEYFTPILIICDERAEKLVHACSESIESIYITVKAEDLFSVDNTDAERI